MISSFFALRESDIHYLQYGNGKTIMVALHGYGESAESFRFLHKHLSGNYRVIAIDLPFHGCTQWKETRGFANTDMVFIIDEIFKEIGLQDAEFVLIGYSMGGRVALSITENMPSKVTRLILLAPEGMTVNFWYWLATQTRPGNRLFRFTMSNPELFFKVLRIANTFNLINKSIFKFIFHYINDEKVRNDLYHRWTCLSNIKPDLQKIKSIIKEKKLPVQMLYGRHDRVILPERAGYFCKGLEQYCRLHIINAGHKVLQQKHAVAIVSLLTT